MDSLGQKMITGGAWLFITRFLSSVLQFSRTIILARILAPSDFGLFSIAALSLFLIRRISETGFIPALIQKKEEIAPYLDTVWTVGLIRSLIIILILFFGAPVIGSLFNSPASVPMIRTMTLAAMFQGLSSVAIVTFDKELAYKKYFFFIIGGSLAELVVAITAAVFFQNAWALILGCIAGELTCCLISYGLHPHRPTLHFDIKKVKELFKYGKWIFISGILVYLTTQGDSLFAGKYLGLTALGIYHMAYKFSGLIANDIVLPIFKVTFPVYSQLQEDLPRLKYTYLKTLNFTTFIVFFAAMNLFSLADNIVFTVIGPKWVDTIIIVRILVFQAALWGLQRTLIQVAKAVGHPRIQTVNQSIQLIILLTFIYPFTVEWGLLGLAFLVVFQNIMSFPVLLYLVLPKISLSLSDFIGAVAKQIPPSVITGVVLFYIQNHLPFNLFTLAGELFVGIVIYLAASFIFDREIFINIAYIKKVVWAK